MNHHARSYSEQPQAAPMAVGNNQHQSFIRHHSDSQQSLDQLFNLSHQPSVPLRNRNLPQSFFNPGTKANNTDATNGTTNGHATNDVHLSNGNNLHMRSLSFDQHQPVPANRPASQRLNLHTRTHSTIVPMPRLLSNHSSQEFLSGSAMQPDSSQNASANNVSSPNHNSSSLQQSYHNHERHSQHHSNNHTHHTLTNGWSSAGNSLDDLPTSPQWSAAQTVSSVPAQAAGLQQQVQVGAIARPVLPEPAPMQQATHQQAFYSAHSIPAAEASNPPHMGANNMHSRSFSFNQRPETQLINHGFHMRTHSTIAPMSSGPCNLHPAVATVASHQSSHQSSQDFLNHSSATTASAVWSSSGYSTDDMTANGHCWNGGSGGPPTSQLPMTAAPSSATAQGSVALHHHQHHHHHHQHGQPLVTQAQDPQSQQVFYQQV